MIKPRLLERGGDADGVDYEIDNRPGFQQFLFNLKSFTRTWTRLYPVPISVLDATLHPVA
jgi:hypothetical protein